MKTNGTLVCASVLAAVVASAFAAPASAQYEDVPRPAAYALEGVTVVQPDGRRLEDMTVVVRGRLIESIERNAPVPSDAERLEGDGLIVYPGIVDGNGEAEHEFPEPDIDMSQVEIWNAPRSLQGFMPARRLVAHLTADGESVADKRREGIVAAAVHPEGAMMGGRGALLLYRLGVEQPDRLVIDAALGPKFEWEGGRRVYPGTLFGVTAFFRQAFEDARHRAALAEAHERNPEGLTVPPYDPDYSVLQEVLAGDLPVYFEADQADDILRVLHLADEYGFRPLIVGGGEAWQVADELLERDVPVLVDVSFREPERWDPEADTLALDAPTLREKQDLENRYANAGRLARAGVTFALTSGGTGEILDGVRQAVEYGLEEDAALQALTATPAALFGIPHITRLEEGLPATFMVSRGSLFEEDSEIAYTFVEGRMEEAAAQDEEAAGDPEDAVSFAGEWQMTINAEGQRMQATLQIEQDGATFEGTMLMQGQTLQVRDGTINGNEIRAEALMEQGGEELEIEITGTVEGDEASGEADAGPLGIARWTARRTGPGGAR